MEKDQEFKVSLSYVKPYLKKRERKKKHKSTYSLLLKILLQVKDTRFYPEFSTLRILFLLELCVSF